MLQQTTFDSSRRNRPPARLSRSWDDSDGKEKIFDEAMFEVRILQIVNTSDDTWMNISG